MEPVPSSLVSRAHEEHSTPYISAAKFGLFEDFFPFPQLNKLFLGFFHVLLSAQLISAVDPRFPRQAGLGRTALGELLWSGCNMWDQVTPFWVCLSMVM